MFIYSSFLRMKFDGPYAFTSLAVILIPCPGILSDTIKSPIKIGSIGGISNSGIPLVKYGLKVSTE